MGWQLTKDGNVVVHHDGLGARIRVHMGPHGREHACELWIGQRRVVHCIATRTTVNDLKLIAADYHTMTPQKDAT